MKTGKNVLVFSNLINITKTNLWSDLKICSPTMTKTLSYTMDNI